MKNSFTAIIFVMLSLFVFSATAFTQDEIKLIIRGDDFGMTQGSLLAFEKDFNEGLLTSGAIVVPGPWFEGAAELAKKNPGWCVGVHLCLIAEWRGYRWRPVLPYDKVPTIVDADGFLFQSPEDLKAHNPKLSEIEAEYRAQIELAKKRGVNVQYIDTHYIMYNEYPGLEDLFQKLSKEYNVPISGRAGDKFFPTHFYDDPPELKEANLIKDLENLGPGLWVLMSHPGVDTPEQNALIHSQPKDIFMNGGVGKNRAAELAAITSINVKSVILRKGIKLTNYREVWAEKNKK